MKLPGIYLSKREQQVMEVLFQADKLTANEVLEQLPDSLSNSSVRTHLRILEEKGVIRHEEVDGKFVYFPVQRKRDVAESALKRVVSTFFRGSVTQAVATLLTNSEARLSSAEIAELEALVQQAKENSK